MNPAWTLAAWTCVGLVALPMSPCALLPRMCSHLVAARAAAGHAPLAAAERPSCCAERDSSPGNSSPEKPAAPCPRGCCRLTPIGPTVEKVVAADGVWSAPCLADRTIDRGVVHPAAAQEARLPAQTLHSLSCLWRC
jgi:hypothetical protein